MEPTKVYKVGGAVRDLFLGRPENDRDYVVIGESPESMIAMGFEQVGVSFPVFLHPISKDEYALARTERSTGPKHTDFEYCWAGVSLEEDLFRRDLTINAMALDADGSVIDPYGGLRDLKSKSLRHVSDHFQDDPLRVLRAARFSAQLGFTVAPETLALMSKMTGSGMLDSLSAERVWKEVEKALLSENPRLFFEVLESCGALKVMFPELDKMKGVVQRQDYHAEGDVWTHTLMVLDEAVQLTASLSPSRALRIRVAALMHDLGKAETPAKYLWNEDGSIRGQHPGHDEPKVFAPSLNAIAERIKLPSKYTRFAYLSATAHQRIHRIADMTDRGLVRLYETLDLDRALRHDAHLLDDIVLLCEADNHGRRQLMPDGSLMRPTRYRQGSLFKGAMTAIKEVNVGAVIQEELKAKRTLEHAKGEARKAQRACASRYLKNQTIYSSDKGLDP